MAATITPRDRPIHLLQVKLQLQWIFQIPRVQHQGRGWGYGSAPLPLDVRPYFIVGKWHACLRVAENRNPNMNEPTSHVNPSDDARVVKPGVYLTTDTATQAFYWRLRIEEYARLTILPLAKERGEKEHDSRKWEKRMP